MGNDRTNDAQDRSLLTAVGSGDRAALRALYERHAPWLVIRLTRGCADPGVVEEVVQDTFGHLEGSVPVPGKGEVLAWIWGIGVRRLIDRLRGKRRDSCSTTRPAETICSVPTSLVVRRMIRVGVGIPLVWAIWGVLAWYAGTLTAPAAVEFAGMFALTLALAGIGAAVLDDVRGGLFATPALSFCSASPRSSRRRGVRSLSPRPAPPGSIATGGGASCSLSRSSRSFSRASIPRCAGRIAG